MSYLYLLLIVCAIRTVSCVRCYQCASSQNKEEDTCGAYKKFDVESHIAVECNSDESHTPGSFCMKLTQQGPKGFISVRKDCKDCSQINNPGKRYQTTYYCDSCPKTPGMHFGNCNMKYHTKQEDWMHVAKDQTRGATMSSSGLLLTDDNGDGRWRQVIRRCASVAETGVTGVCNWGVYPNGVYWEECYCSADECNASTAVTTSTIIVISSLAFTLYATKVILS